LDLGKISNFFLGVELIAETIIAGANHIGSKVSNVLDTFKEWGNNCEWLHNLDTISKDSPLFNVHENILLVEWIKDSFINEDIEIIDLFFEDLMLKPTPERRYALWQIIHQSDRWKEINPNGLIKYLHVSVKNEANRIIRDREKSDRLWGKFDVYYADDLKSNVYESNKILTPEVVILRNEEKQIRLKIIQDLIDSGSPREKKMIKLLLAGYTPAECVKAMGEKWSLYQSIQRKLNRNFKKINKECLVT
jgi:hypothetical protein